MQLSRAKRPRVNGKAELRTLDCSLCRGEPKSFKVRDGNEPYPNSDFACFDCRLKSPVPLRCVSCGEAKAVLNKKKGVCRPCARRADAEAFGPRIQAVVSQPPLKKFVCHPPHVPHSEPIFVECCYCEGWVEVVSLECGNITHGGKAGRVFAVDKASAELAEQYGCGKTFKVEKDESGAPKAVPSETVH